MNLKTARVFALGFAAGAAAALLLIYFPSHLIDRYYEQRAESKVIEVWERQAAGVDYDGCRQSPAYCLGKIVEWPVTRQSDEHSYWGGNVSYTIRWLNPKQVPRVPGPNGFFTAVARVKGFENGAIILLYIGSPQAAYSGTTMKQNFGAPVKNNEGFAF